VDYTIHAAAAAPDLNAEWTNPAWASAETLSVQHFRPESGEHRPQTSARLLYDNGGIHGIFCVQDRYVRCVRTQYQQEVWKDSCVEFFARPRLDRGYFNFEFNCGGAFLCSYITNPERTPGGFKEFTRVPAPIGQTIQAKSSLPQQIDPEIPTPILWTLQFLVPFTLFEHYLGPLGTIPGQVWHGNFFKCADETSHPHWASWSPLDELNFHRPTCFGTLRFG